MLTLGICALLALPAYQASARKFQDYDKNLRDAIRKKPADQTTKKATDSQVKKGANTPMPAKPPGKVVPPIDNRTSSTGRSKGGRLPPTTERERKAETAIAKTAQQIR